MSAELSNRLINGLEGQMNIVIDGNVRTLAEVMEVTTDMTLEMSEYKVMGIKAVQTKPKGWKGEGSLKIRYGVRELLDVFYNYKNTGVLPEISLVVINDDPSFEDGAIKIQITGVILNKKTITKLSIDSEILDEEIPFTFTDWTIL